MPTTAAPIRSCDTGGIITGEYNDATGRAPGGRGPSVCRGAIGRLPATRKEVVPLRRQSSVGRDRRRLCRPPSLRTAFRTLANRRVLLGGSRRRCSGHRGNDIARSTFTRARNGICVRQHRRSGLRTRVEHDLLRKAPRRADPDDGLVWIGSMPALGRRRQIPVDRKQQGDQQPAYENEIFDDRHGTAARSSACRRKVRALLRARRDGLIRPLGPRSGSTDRRASRARRSRRNGT